MKDWPHPTPSRREFLLGGGVAALGLIGCTPVRAHQSIVAGPLPPNPAWSKIDVHHHLASPGFAAEIAARNTGQKPLVDWTPAHSIEDMDRGGVVMSLLSAPVPDPGNWFGDDKGRAIAREMNDYAARLVLEHPRRFAMLATVPLPDVDGSLREIEYALDVLKADGVCLLTSYRGKYLGDAAFAPVLDELHRRSAVVYTHPARADCCRNLVPRVPEHIVELETDTTRTILSLLFSGTAARCSNAHFIFSHGGGTLPFLTGRIEGYVASKKELAAAMPRGAQHELRKFFYDTAQAYSPQALASLLQLVPASQVLFGTDFPFATSRETAAGLVASGVSDADRRLIEHDNALGLLPQLASR